LPVKGLVAQENAKRNNKKNKNFVFIQIVLEWNNKKHSIRLDTIK
jgi:hypothetical protein